MFLFFLILDEVEVGFEGWNSMYNCYAFLYSKDEEEGKKKCIFMKCVVIADFLAIDALDLEAQHKEPCTVQIKYVPVLLLLFYIILRFHVLFLLLLLEHMLLASHRKYGL